MDSERKMRNFITKIIYLAIWIGLIYFALKYALPAIMPFVIAFITSFLLKPLINFITKITPLKRKWVAVLVLTLLYAILITLLVFFGIKIIVYIGDAFAGLPKYYYINIEPMLRSFSDSFDHFIVQLDPSLVTFFEMATNNISTAVGNLLTSISSWAINFVTVVAKQLPVFIVALILTIVASYFFVVDYYKITLFIASHLTQKIRHKLIVIKDFTVNVLLKFLKAYLILICITFIEVSVGMLIMGIPYPFLFGLCIAIVDILPILGTGTILIPWTLYSLISGNFFLGIGLLVLYAIVTIVRQILEPRVVGKQIGLYPLLTLICMYVGARLFGFWGLFALPVALTILIHLNRSGEIHLFKGEESVSHAPVSSSSTTKSEDIE